MEKQFVSDDTITNKIYLIRSQKVMLDSDLADLYEVETKVLNQAVNRNIRRFPDDFMFQLTEAEFKNLRFKSLTVIPPVAKQCNTQGWTIS